MIVRHNEVANEQVKYKGLTVTSKGNYFYSLLAQGQERVLAGVKFPGESKFYGLLMAEPFEETLEHLDYKVLNERSATEPERLQVSLPGGELICEVIEDVVPASNGVGTKTFYHLNPIGEA